MKCSFGISDFLEEISSLFHSVVFLYFFALITEEGFLVSSCYSLELCIQMFIHMVQRSHQILCPAWNLSISFWRKKQKKYLPNTIQMLSKTPCGSHHLSWESFTREIKTLTSERFVRTSVGDVDMYGCDSWTIKKAEHQRIDAFELWSWEDSWESLGLQGDPTSPS